MYCVAAFVIVGTLWGWPASVEGVDCTNPQSLTNEMTKCFGQLTGGVGSIEDAQNAINGNTNAACGNLDAYRSGMSCVIRIARNCLVVAGQNPDILPDPDKMADGLEYLCQNIGDLDSQCLQSKQQAILQCVQNRARETGSSSGDSSAESLTCTAFDLTLDCTETGLATCPGKTKEVFVEYTKYSTPPACGACAGGASCLLLLLAALLAVACRLSEI